MLSQILYFTLCFCLSVYWLLVRGKRKANTPPEMTGKLPIIGHAHIFFGNSLHAWKVIKRIATENIQNKGVITLSLGSQTVYALADPDDCFVVSNACLKKDYLYNFANSWLGEGLLTGSVPVWRFHRRLLSPAFSQQILNGFIGVFNDKAKQLTDELMNEEGKGPFDVHRYLSFNNLEIICQTTLGININENIDMIEDYENAILQIFKIFKERFQRIWLHNSYIFNKSSLKKRQDEVVKVLHNMSYSALQKRKAELNKKNVDNVKENTSDKFQSFVDVIIKMSSAIPKFTDNDIRELVDNIIFAGHDTISTVMLYALILIGSYPEVQERVYKEIIEVSEHSEIDCNKEHCVKMPYLEAVLKETIRLYPIAPIIARYVESDIKLKNYTIPKGCSCYLLLWGLHYHPMWGSDVDQFRPERWLEPHTLPDNPNFFAGFSIGRRNCIGKTYAMMSMKITLRHLIRRFRIIADVNNMELKYEALLKPAFGHYISIERRDNNNTI